jgi:hypothetical protein
VKFFDDVYIGRDNYIARRIETLENVSISISDLTRCTLEIVGSTPPYVIDSDVEEYENVFDWDTYGTQGLLGLRLGLIQDLPTGFLTFKLIIYSDDFPNGLDALNPLYFRVWPLSDG